MLLTGEDSLFLLGMTWEPGRQETPFLFKSSYPQQLAANDSKGNTLPRSQVALLWSDLPVETGEN